MRLFRHTDAADRAASISLQYPWVVLPMLMTLSVSLLLLAFFPGWLALTWASGLTALAALGVVAWGWCSSWRHMLYLWIGAAFFLVGFPLNTFLIACGLDVEQYILPTDYESISLSFQVGVVGWAAWTMGFLHRAKPMLRTKRSSLGGRRERVFSPAGLMAVAAIGLMGKITLGLLLHSQAGNQLFEKVGTLFSILGTFGLVAVFVLYGTGGKRQRGFAIALLVISSASGLLTGQRTEMFKGIIFFILFLMLRRNMEGLPMRKLGWAIAAVLAGFVLLYPALTQYKIAMSASRQESSGLERALLLMETLPSAGSEGGGASWKGASHFLVRMSQVQFGAHLVTTGRAQWGLLKGRSLYECAIMFIPRFLWRAKPTIGLGPEAYALLGFKEGTGSTVIPVAVDWYLNFDWIGVLAGMWLTGLFVSGIHQALGGGGVMRNATLVVISMEVCQAGTGLKSIISTLVIYGVGCLVMERLLTRRRRMVVCRAVQEA